MHLNFRSVFERPVYIIDGLRTPWLKVCGEPGVFSAADLAMQVCRHLLARQVFLPNQLDEVVTACVMANPNEPNISNVIALRLGCAKTVPAYTVQRNCASGLQALDSAAIDIATGRYEIILAGGTEAMSRSTLLFSQKMTQFLAHWNSAKTLRARTRCLIKFSINYLVPAHPLFWGLSDPIAGLSSVQTAEIIAHRFSITREQMDQWALQSHKRLANAQNKDILKNEINIIYDENSHYYSYDNGLLRNSSLEKFATLKPILDEKFGLITAGNSSQMTDGAAFLILASEKAIKHFNLPVLARIVDVSWAGVNLSEKGLGAAHAVAKLLKKQKLNFKSIDFWEINEAFAGQVLACLAAWRDSNYCKSELGLSQALGELDTSIINIDGGAIAMGHPIGASGARIVLHLVHVLRRKKARLGIATLCTGGQGGALLLEIL